MIFENRKAGNNVVAYGGVGIFWKKAACDFKIVNIKNNADFEIISAIGSVKGYSRNLALITCYLPPNYQKTRANAALD